MRVLLKAGADEATAETILVLPQRTTVSLETLSGDAAPYGVFAEADEKSVVAAVNDGAEQRDQFGVSAQEMYKDLKWLHKALADYEVGSKIGLKAKGRSYVLDDSEAKRINRAEGLTKGDLVAIGPTISPRTLMNARGRVLSIKGDEVEIALDAGDRDRLARAGKHLAERTTFPLLCVEKVAKGSQ